MGQTDQAVAASETAVRLSPATAEFRGQFAVVLLQQGKTREAIASLRKALELDSQNGLAQYQLAVALQRTGKTAEAQEHFQKVAELKKAKLDFEKAGLHMIQGIAHLRASRIAEAVSELREAGADSPAHPGA